MATISKLLLERLAAEATNPALHVHRAGKFQAYSWSQLFSDVRRYTARFIECGLAPGDAVAQFSENRYEWILADFAMQLLGLVHVPIHSTLSAAQVIQQVTHSEAKLLLVSNAALHAKLTAQLAQTPFNHHVRLFGYDTSDILERFDSSALPPTPVHQLEDTVLALHERSLATILYTSGTTGTPKGVMLSQGNLAHNAVETNRALHLDDSHLRLCFLPLSHIFARTCDLYTWVVNGSQLALAQSRTSILQDAQAVKPTIMNGVPYFYSNLRRQLESEGQPITAGALSEAVGGRIRFFCSGGAALPPDLHAFYQQQGVPLLQGYGLTETSPVVSVSSDKVDRRGAVGQPIAGAVVRIAPDGEVLIQGEHVMMGYFRNEDATHEILRDGWLHSGDLGELDDDGFLYITGRKKELIVTATGKNVSPSYLEALLTDEPMISQAFVVGNNRRYLSALLWPDIDYLDGLMIENDSQDTEVVLRERITNRLADCAKHEQIAKFTIVDRPLSMEKGELTAKLSLCRHRIESNFSDMIEAMYRDQPSR